MMTQAKHYPDGNRIRLWIHAVIVGERTKAGRYVPATEQETDELQAIIEGLAECEGYRFYWSEESAESLRRRILAV